MPQPKKPSLSVGEQEIWFRSAKNLSCIPDESVDFIITSPPYWNLKNYESPDEIGKGTYEEYLDDLNLVWAECYRVAAPHCVMVVNIGHRRHKKQYYPLAFHIAGRIADWSLWDVNIWHIPNALPQPKHYMDSLLDNKHEYLLVFRKDMSQPYMFDKPRVPHKYADPRKNKLHKAGRCLGNVLRLAAYRPPNIKQMGWHQAAYPDELVAFFLAAYTKPGDLVLDPFLGSGTTLKVAEGMDRRGIGIEANAKNRALLQTRLAEPFRLPEWAELDAIEPLHQRSGQRRPSA